MTCTEQNTTDARPTVLVIDDELGPRESLRFLLKDNYEVVCKDSVDGGLQFMNEHAPDVVVMDIRMPGKNGIEGLREIRKLDPKLSVIMLTGFAAVGTAQEAIRHEASDYIEKPFDAQEMRRVVHHQVEQTRLRRKREQLISNANALSQKINDLQRKEQLAELGQTSAEFVHDLRNVLSGVTGSSSLLRLEVEELQQCRTENPSEAGHYLDMMENAMRRCVDLLDSWQRLIRKDPQQHTVFRVHPFVRDCVDSSRSGMPDGISLVCETVGEDTDLSADRIQLTRVLTNLIQNASHALPSKQGEIRVRSEVLKDHIRLTVSDNGCGIPEESLPLLFSPDFTTRRALGGMGLGLFIAKKVVEAHNGTITVDSTPNVGSAFTLRIPLAPAVTDSDAV